MVFCIKIERRRYNEVIKSLKVNPDYAPFFDGDFAYIPLVDQAGEECNPPPRSKVKKLNQIVPGLRSYYIVGEIALITDQGDEKDYSQAASYILDVYKKVRSVYLRKKVTGPLRINQVRLIAGKDDPVTEYKENGLRFIVDVTKVYVNPTMANERIKVSENLKSNLVLDAFAGYGPFSLHLARKGIAVVAGDLNLDGLYMLKLNAELNKLRGWIDIVQYDASYLPFRDSSFETVIADNPTIVENFKKELCRVGKMVIFYTLSESEQEASRKIFKTSWVRVNDYAKNLYIFKGVVRCDNENS
ncbi:class I SAM-dependent methyltransferase [Sulfuracidifex tepidarius]|uniref:tRNA (Guanine(37)-N1)-methyltransferase Trm5b n=1 Tax=Sulfuracidifex tepidarius TaxID=1294262 RepID=A0A510E6E5_9CREN|nr:methyltransferase domain-containing protein [Sulfuracidifex tepidarius]BBG28112.1 tRNA (guanine(37)-N1)-methyltransferase Trm5b [Sulfuracidifex tepidarius]